VTLISSAPARLALVIGLGVFHPLTQHRQRDGGGVFGGPKPVVGRVENPGVGDLVLGRYQLIGDLIKRGDGAFY
jgi:hypothetical protein